MNEVKTVIDGRESVFNVPSCFDELSREQLLAVCRFADGDGGTGTGFVSLLTGIPSDIWNSLHFGHKYHILRLLDFVSEGKPSFTKQLLPYIDAGGIRMIGFQPNFSNTTWEEFIYADGYMLAGLFKQAAAVLYRPQRDGYNGETDRRVPFSIYGTDTRLNLFGQVSSEQLLAFVLCYKTLRKRNLEEKYPNVFARSAPRETSSRNAAHTSFSWVSVHRDLMGDQFFDEGKFYASNVHVVLGRLDKVIRDSWKK